MSEKVTIKSGTIKLDGVLNKNTSKDAVVITHPHPLYGGNMDNPVVLTIEGSFFEKGFSTLRFDFRGTRNSMGMFDNGIGEQDDVRAAIFFLKDLGFEKLYLAGYSFGSRMNAGVVAGGTTVSNNVMVSPPVAFMSFKEIKTLTSTGLIVTGANDDIAPPDGIESHIKNWEISPRFDIIEHCDHFYSHSLGQLKEILLDYL
jgi:uncharacterized protein